MPERQWHGDISVDQGTISIIPRLGIVSDVPGSIWSAGNNRIEIRDRSLRSYDGVDVEDRRTDRSVAAGFAQSGARFRSRNRSPLPLDKTIHGQLDKQGNQLVVLQIPGDMLRVSMNRDSLVSSGGETWDLEVSPQLGLAEPGTTRRSQIQPDHGPTWAEKWSQEKTIKWPAAGEPRPMVATPDSHAARRRHVRSGD